MRVLHTSDWHLGQKFIGQHREFEHQLFLDWLIETVARQKPDILLISGDIFDVHNPPASSDELYFTFLANMLRSPCKHIIITAGNHDSVVRLEAPRAILKHLNVQIIGKAPENPADTLLLLKDEKTQPIAYVAAVPYLREKDLGQAEAGETFKNRIKRIQSGIKAYYHACVSGLDTDLVEKEQLPVLGMGHLFATGASAGEEQRNIYIGNLQNIAADDFPRTFDYVALGHIHRPQIVGKQAHIRYCGSPIPLSFSEVKDEKQILQIDFSGKKITEIKSLPVPTFRKVVRLKGDLSTIQIQINNLAKAETPLTTWAEIHVESKSRIAGLEDQIRRMVEGLPIDVLKFQNIYPGKTLSEQVQVEKLEDMTPEEVFIKKIEGVSLQEGDKERLLIQFRELLEGIQT